MENKKTSSKMILILSLICVIAIAGVISEIFYFVRQSEQKREIADLQNMQCADLTAQLFLSNGAIEEKSSYWYDSANFTLLKQDSEKPNPYGSGTESAGGGIEAFQKDQGISYDYDEKADYTGKIIRVTIDPETEKITLDWVE